MLVRSQFYVQCRLGPNKYQTCCKHFFFYVRKTRQSVYLPAHLYGELCRHSGGAELLAKEKIPSRIADNLRKLVEEETSAKAPLVKENYKKDDVVASITKMKSYVWALVSRRHNSINYRWVGLIKTRAINIEQALSNSLSKENNKH